MIGQFAIAVAGLIGSGSAPTDARVMASMSVATAERTGISIVKHRITTKIVECRDGGGMRKRAVTLWECGVYYSQFGSEPGGAKKQHYVQVVYIETAIDLK